VLVPTLPQQYVKQLYIPLPHPTNTALLLKTIEINSAI
jgi:hypothetical protein